MLKGVPTSIPSTPATYLLASFYQLCCLYDHGSGCKRAQHGNTRREEEPHEHWSQFNESLICQYGGKRWAVNVDIKCCTHTVQIKSNTQERKTVYRGDELSRHCAAATLTVEYTEDIFFFAQLVYF